MYWYTDSLYAAGGISNNYWRLQALENLELIIGEKRREEKERSKSVIKGKSGRITAPPAISTLKWKRKTKIYDMLSHHYILRKSIVFIVDTEYSSVIYQDLANKFIKK